MVVHWEVINTYLQRYEQTHGMKIYVKYQQIYIFITYYRKYASTIMYLHTYVLLLEFAMALIIQQ